MRRDPPLLVGFDPPWNDDHTSPQGSVKWVHISLAARSSIDSFTNTNIDGPF